MKKLFSLITIVLVLFMAVLTTNVFAQTTEDLSLANLTLDKLTVKPGEEVTLTINFGAELGAYTIDVAYDSSLFDFLSNSDGADSNTATGVKVVYYSATEGRENLKLVFKAKDDIITTNTSNFAVTASGMASKDTEISYNDITTPLSTNITVEPDYKNYELNLKYDGEIVVNKEKAITVTTTSELGKNYNRARLIAEATTPEGGSVSLIGTDENQMEYDLISNGWGDTNGYQLGGKNVNQVLKLNGLFTKEGDYTIKLKLIDRDTDDTTITEKSFKISVVSESKAPDEQKGEETKKTEETKKSDNVAKKENTTPEELPKTGVNFVAIGLSIIALLVLCYVLYNKKD